MIYWLLTTLGIIHTPSVQPPNYYAICDMKTGICHYVDRATDKPSGEPWKFGGEKEWIEANTKPSPLFKL